MGLWSRIAGALRQKNTTSGPASVGDELWDAWEESWHSGAGMAINAFTAMQSVAVMACVTLLAEDVAKVPVQVMRRGADHGKDPARDHPLSRLLRYPNEWQTRLEFIEMMMGALLLRGNAYAVMLRDGRGRVEQLIPIHPDRVTLYESPGGEYFFFVTRQGLHEMAVLRDEPMLIPQEDVFHLRGLASWNSLLGVSRIQLHRDAIGLSIAQTGQAARLAGNGARPSGVLQTDAKLAQDVKDRLQHDWQKAYGGWRNTGKTAVLEQGVKWQPLGMTSVDAEFLASRKFQVEEIARMFRVPPHKIGIIEGRVAGSAFVQQDQDYINSVLSSYCDRWKLKLERDFDIDGEEYFVEFDYEHILKADIQTRLAAKRTGVVSMIYTPNEARRGEGLPAVKGGDTLYQPTNVAPIGFQPAGAGDTGPGSDVTGAPAPGGSGEPDEAPSS